MWRLTEGERESTEHDPGFGGERAPGRQSLTQRLAASRSQVQRTPDPAGATDRAAIDAHLHRMLDAAVRPDLHDVPVQRRGAGAADDAAVVREAAARGTEGAGEPLPFGDQIQRAFGHHDVSGVRAHTGPAARDAARAMGADAFASDGQVAFGRAPDLHTAAHEAAHVVQQRGGVQLAGGVGQAGDPYERHADAVADRVVAGQSAADLLDAGAGPRGSSSSAVQRLETVVNGQIVDLKKEQLEQESDCGELVSNLSIVVQDDKESDDSKHVRLLKAIRDAVAVGAINRGVVIAALDALAQGKPDWTQWQELEDYKASTQPVIDKRDLSKSTITTNHKEYFFKYHQNLKDKGMDYEDVVEKFVTQNKYKMGLGEAHAIFGYTSLLYYKRLNELLRDGALEPAALLTKLLQGAIAKLPIETEVQYRAIDVPDDELEEFLKKHAANKTVSYEGFLSAGQHQVQPFWDQSNIRFKLKPQTARNITELAFGAHFIKIQSKGARQNDKHESLFPPGATFIVDSIEKKQEPVKDKKPVEKKVKETEQKLESKVQDKSQTEDILEVEQPKMRDIYYIEMTEQPPENK